ncbi:MULTISPECIES: isochorismate synthase MenF [unclassified Microbacterium]|uniref:isochorismate synthase n=1 Tax=unclassified Microbacterium TaxID=2609290 RepID=UPI001E632D80|nr:MULTISPECIES: isochorismate synthase [unclassified Microbacterium]
MTESAPSRVRRLVVTTREIDPIEDLLAYADPAHPLAWLRRGEGMVGFGSAAIIEVGGHRASPSQGSQAAALADGWRATAAAAMITDEVGLPGTGLIAFGALSFDPASATASTLVVPQFVFGRRAGRSWITTVVSDDAEAPNAPDPSEWGPAWSATVGPGELDAPGYQAAVRAGLEAIAAGEVSKVVLARDLIGSVPAGADLRRLVRALATGYPDVWTYAVDGIIGASPETLVTVSGGTITARVLAGTAPRGADADGDTEASVALSASGKDQDEHRFAVESVLRTLRPHTSVLTASEQPFALKLPNVWHLATDVEGIVADGVSALDLVGVLHPTAAVAGTPTAAALEVIRRIEPFDRGRYAGPVGWIDASGDGEWAIALRSAQFGEGGRISAHAGAGIVLGSDPEAELLETRMKFRPIVDALA